MRRANLSGTLWRGAELDKARFSRNNLMGADLRGLNLRDVRLGDSTVHGVTITPGQESDFLDALEILRDKQASRQRHVWLPTP